MSINDFPTDDQLKAYVTEHLQHFKTAVESVTGDLGQEYFQSVKLRQRGWKVVAGSGVLGFFSLSGFEFSPILAVTLLATAGLGLALGTRMIRSISAKQIREVTTKAHLALLPPIAAAAGVNSIVTIEQRIKNKADFDTAYSKPGENIFESNSRLAKVSQQLFTTYDQDELVERLKQARLLPEIQSQLRRRFVFSTIHAVETSSRTIRFSQLYCSPPAETVGGSGIRILLRKLSRSLFIEIPVSQTFTGTTVVTTEKFSGGTKQKTLVESLKKIGVNVSELEWNDFENLLHVITDNEIEARYILTPDFMESVYLWWQGKNQEIRISFTNNTISILLFGDTVSFGADLADLSDEKIKEHIEAMLIPLVHCLQLANAYDHSR